MKRNVFGIVLPCVWIAIGVIPFVLAWDRLPEPMASHWGLSGTPNGALPRMSMIGLTATATALAAFVACLITRPGARSRVVSATCGIAAFVGCMFATISIIVVRANVDVQSWRDARPMSLALVGVVVAVSAVAAAGVSRAMRSLDVHVPVAAAERATVGLAPGERATWMAGAHNRGFWLAAVALVAVAVIARTLAPGWTAAPCLVLALTLAAFAEIHARVDDRGLSIAFGPWQLPRMRVPLAKIRSARAIDIDPMSSGGWGYRGSLTVLGRAAVIVRRGEGLELQLADDRVLIVSVDDAKTAAGLLNDLTARR
ncbi:MAG TPA: DUF1648 domain-containing protein [Kofleriaceae bacterium]|jgi:hypothetical protein